MRNSYSDYAPLDAGGRQHGIIDDASTTACACWVGRWGAPAETGAPHPFGQPDGLPLPRPKLQMFRSLAKSVFACCLTPLAS